jgi:hypothetical protein
MAAIMEKPARKPYSITDAERARRADVLRPYAAAGGRANIAKHGSEGMSKAGKVGGKVQHERYKLLMMSIKPESPEDLRRRRVEIEAKREQILEALTKAALGQQAPDADCAIISAALRELRAEADRLIDREARAKAEQAQQAATGPARAALVPATSPAILPALVAEDPAPDSPGLVAD